MFAAQEATVKQTSSPVAVASGKDWVCACNIFD